MEARALRVAGLLGAALSALIAVSPLTAAMASSSVAFASPLPARQPVFRVPMHGLAPNDPVRATHQASGRSTPRLAEPGSRRARPLATDARRGDLIATEPRAGARKAVPVTRGQDLGLRFRPDERESPYGQVVVPQGGMGAGTGYEGETQSQFRPVQPRRKRTYEEIQADSEPAGPALPPMPYPTMPMPPMPGYPPGLPAW